MSAVGRSSGIDTLREYWASSRRNGLVAMNTSTAPEAACCARSFSAARLAKRLMARVRSMPRSTGAPNERQTMICWLGAGASSNLMQLVPRSSRSGHMPPLASLLNRKSQRRGAALSR